MIVGIGVDIVKTDRFAHWLTLSGLLERFFHPIETEYICRLDSAQTAAGRFAAKEAFAKALGTGFRDLSLRNICTVNDSGGKPVMQLYGDAARAFVQSGAQQLHVSISHEKEYACAFVVLERL